MLTIKDLSASKELDRAAMTTVRGGHGRPSSSITNAPNLDFSSDVVFQTMFAGVDQSGNIGGLNFTYIDQSQVGNA